VVAKNPAWQQDAMTQADPKAQAPFGGDDGGVGFGGAGATGDFGPGKLAGADSEAGQRSAPAEPWSVLSATQEHLDLIDKSNGFGDAVSTIGSGIGEAVSKGAEGAGQALGKTWDELTTNEDLHKGVEFGGKVAWEVTKDVTKTVRNDIGFNSWDTAADKGAECLGLGRVARVASNPAITIPINKVIGMGRVVGDVWGGKQERDTIDLGKRIDSIYEGVYGRKR
jgi:hypothetical protein